jgi:predicted NAD/FAD-binding protein
VRQDTNALKIAVIGAGISGLSAAWLLGQRHDVTLYEKESRLGGHSRTVTIDTSEGPVPVDTGFIVYNDATYPNLSALFRHLDVATAPADMGLAVSLDGGRLEYNGSDLNRLFAQRRNIVSPRFWSMLRDLLRFYREAPTHVGTLGLTSLGEYLVLNGYGQAFRDDHLLPMAAAIWSAPAHALLDYPAEAFISFCRNHGLLNVSKRPQWRTVSGGSRVYVDKLAALYGKPARGPVRSIQRQQGEVLVLDEEGEVRRYDHIVIAAHADQALAMLSDPSPEEQALLGAFRYSRNVAVAHCDPSMMPKRRSVWASWNFMGASSQLSARELCVTYWMNKLQPLATSEQIFVTLNPPRAVAPDLVRGVDVYEHPLFDAQALTAQEDLWALQGRRNTWFCGAHFGYGFHEDGLQSGLAVAEALGGVRRPWDVSGQSDRMPSTAMNEAA